MNFFRRCATLFYVTIVMFLGCFLLLLALNWLKLGSLFAVLHVVYTDDNLRLVTGILAGLLLFKNYLYYQMFTVNVRQGKIIAFDNPSGRVSVSLLALDDLVRRAIAKLPEVKDVKTGVTASRKGLDVKVKLILRSERNIPDLTSKIQTLVQRKIQDIIGLSDPVNVTVYVGKILSDKVGSRAAEKEEVEEELLEPQVPFHGYRA